MISVQDLIKNFPKRPAGSHKGSFGHVLVVAGSAGYTGAAYLSSQATALTGSGLVTLAVGKSLYPVMAVKLTEVMVRPFFETKDYSLSLMAEKDLAALAEKCDAIVMGPGISRNKETQELVRNLLRRLDKPVVLDADGIHACAQSVESIKDARARLIITPHPGEMAALTGKTADEIALNRKDIALKYANEYNTVLVLKGHNTVVAAPGQEPYVNQTGNAGMATGGTGDVLAGMIAGFAAQGVDNFKAAVLGVYFHGLAGDMAMREKGPLSLLATDLLNKLPEALKVLG